MRSKIIIYGSMILIALFLVFIAIVVIIRSDWFIRKSVIDDFNKDEVVYAELAEELSKLKKPFSFDNENYQNTGRLGDLLNKAFCENNMKYIETQGNEIYFAQYIKAFWGYGVVYSESGNKPKSELIRSLQRINDNWFYYCSE